MVRHSTSKRVAKLTRELASSRWGGVVISPGPNMTYYTGVRAQLLERLFLLFAGRDGELNLLAPHLEAGPFREAGIDITVHDWDDTQGPGRALEEVLAGIDSRAAWGCEGRVPFGFLNHLLARGMKVEPADQMLQGIRAVKEASELDSFRKSARILVGAYMKIPGWLREGMTERELSKLVVEDVLADGGESIGCMVQSGARAADPHSDTSSRKIGRGESVVVDAVSFFDGYAADITRTFVIGKDPSFERVYSSVLQAQEEAVAKAAPGVAVGAVDKAARDALTRDGLGDRFIHRTGHGLGLEVHEAPYIVPGGRDRLQTWMVFTVEPGAYLPGKLGVRIEDDLITTKRGNEVTTRELPKELGWWR
ncbi:MAG TPA: Xaa-Pro peptidase family protein [Nitrososphaerales archaeon]|nr:Xaa-Pro peptidase family protein [Nitrososphaerales archaeon]